jgi:hypothetical protein
VPVNLRDASHEVNCETHIIEMEGDMLRLKPRGPGYTVLVHKSAIDYLVEM